MLDVGSSTGGFTDYALRHGAQKVYAVDVGTDQLHPSLHNNPKIELHEQTDIRNCCWPSTRCSGNGCKFYKFARNFATRCYDK